MHSSSVLNNSEYAFMGPCVFGCMLISIFFLDRILFHNVNLRFLHINKAMCCSCMKRKW